MNTTHPLHPPLEGETLSAWVDGEVSADEAESFSKRWDANPQARAAWHRYQWLGDALRSPDLALHDVAHDVAFVRRWRVQLGADLPEKPVVNLADKRPAAPVRHANNQASNNLQPERSSWSMAWAAVLAGVMVSGVFWVTQRGSSDAAPVMARLPAPTASTLVSTAPALVLRSQVGASSALSVEPVAASQAVLRDPRLDAYLMAHNPFGRGATLAPAITRVQAAASVGQ